MNERIRELIKQMDQAETPTGGGAFTLYDTDLEYFAELIVQDLIHSMIKRYGDDDELPIQEIKLFVKKHFGVGE
jgi:hypothetical protein